jgi:hypothetical protein
MSLQMEARRPIEWVAPEEEAIVADVTIKLNDVNPLFPKSMVEVRVLTKEEQRQLIEEWENRERLPELSTTRSRKVLELINRWNVRVHEPGYGGADECGTIDHLVFVQAHHHLPYTTTHLKSQWDKDIFTDARDFIRECALNGYEATYG